MFEDMRGRNLKVEGFSWKFNARQEVARFD
jgi:hypothetical protein